LAFRTNNRYFFPWFSSVKTSKKENLKMKAMLMKVLRFLKLEVLLLGLIEKLARGLVKKLSALETVAKNALEQARKLREQKH
jgi:hypothetical protein